jgi:hypothetical protein
LRARHYDLIVIGRPTAPNGLPPNLLERLLLGSGRPLLIPSRSPSHPLLSTVLVCWKETAEASRAVGAAMPLLTKAERVVVAGVEEDDPSLANGLTDLSSQLAWHGINASIEFFRRQSATRAKCCWQPPALTAPVCWSWAATGTAIRAKSFLAALPSPF